MMDIENDDRIDIIGLIDLLPENRQQGDGPPVMVPHAEPSVEHHAAEKQTDTVSAINKCASKFARKLCIYDITYKLLHPDTYDIGGTYAGADPEVWFYYSTTMFSGHNFLLNLFVCHRKTGNITIGVSSSNEVNNKRTRSANDSGGHCYLPDTKVWNSFRTAQPNEHYYIKTFCFSEVDMKVLEKCTLYIPVNVESSPNTMFNNDVIKQIKLNHDFEDLLVKREESDFVLESASQKQFPVHKIIIAAHSSKLRSMIKKTSTNSLCIDISDKDMELLLQFIYTGTIKQILKQDCLKLLHIADKFQMKPLFLLTQHAISEQINVKNAVEIAILSENYGLVALQSNVFEFIKNNPEVLESEGWKNLSDVNLTKKLFQFIHKSRMKE